MDTGVLEGNPGQVLDMVLGTLWGGRRGGIGCPGLNHSRKESLELGARVSTGKVGMRPQKGLALLWPHPALESISGRGKML